MKFGDSRESKNFYQLLPMQDLIANSQARYQGNPRPGVAPTSNYNRTPSQVNDSMISDLNDGLMSAIEKYPWIRPLFGVKTTVGPNGFEIYQWPGGDIQWNDSKVRR